MTVRDSPSSLAIVESGYRGALETQYFDALYSAVELHRQFGGLEILLRGSAASYAIDAEPVPAPLIGTMVVETMNDPRRGIRRLLGAGVRIWVEEAGLEACGLDRTGRLISGIERVPPGTLARRWPRYRSVFFL